MKIQRDIMPPIREIENIRIQHPEKIILHNGIPVYILERKDIESVKMDILFNAGQLYQPDKFISSFCNQMMREGTASYTSTQIAEKLDYYGVFSENIIQKNLSGYGFFILNRHFDKVLPTIAEILMQATFPEKELELHKKNIHKRLLIEQSKVNSLAIRKFNNVIFGSKHPLGFEIIPEDIFKIENDTLKQFASQRITANNCQIIISGKVTKQILESIDKSFGGKSWNKSYKEIETNTNYQSHKELSHCINKNDALQSALRLGKIITPQTSDAIFGLKIMNTILGGYFGSRLMNNLREDKGYTYGIYSMINLMRSKEIIFSISAEVGKDVSNSALKEINKEIQELINNAPDKEEMQLVKRYMLGNMLSLFDGPFASANALKGLLEANLDYDFIEKSIDTIKTIKGETINMLAQKYIKPDELYRIVAGKCS